VYISEPEVATLETVGQALVIYPKEVQDGRVQIEKLDRITDNVVREIIRLAVDKARPGSATC
jgi:hypothetical protein